MRGLCAIPLHFHLEIKASSEARQRCERIHVEIISQAFNQPAEVIKRLFSINYKPFALFAYEKYIRHNVEPPLKELV